MTRQEAAKLLAARAAIWSGHPSAVAPTEESEFLAIAEVLADVPLDRALGVLGERRADAHPPTPGQIAAGATDPARPPSWEEAWPLIQRACSRHGSAGREGGLASLPGPVAAWASIRWRALCTAPVEGPDGAFTVGRWRQEWREFREDPAETRRVLAAAAQPPAAGLDAIRRHAQEQLAAGGGS